jgi:5-methylcytosine-specific restriction endonuclease McrA
MKTKFCPKCLIEKSENEFYKCKSRKDKTQVYCKKCSKIIRISRKEKIDKYNKEYYLKKKDKFRKDYLENREKYLNKAKIYRKEHPEMIKKYREEHMEQLIQKARNYNIKNKEKIKIHNLTPKGVYSRLKVTSKSRNFFMNILEEDFINWYNQEQKCYYCGRILEELKQDQREKNKYKDKMSIDRKDNDKGYTIDNIVLACARCNTIKGDYFTEQEMLKIGKFLTKIYKNKEKDND